MLTARTAASHTAASRAAARPGLSARRCAAAAPRAAAAAPGSQQAPANVPVTFNLNHKARHELQKRGWGW